MDVKIELAKNMTRYIELKKLIEKYEEEQGELKKQNLDFVKTLGLKKGDYAQFEEIGLQIQLIEMVNKEGLDEDGLVKTYGKEKTDYLWAIPIKAVELAIKMKKLPPEADDFIKKGEPIQYTKITSCGTCGVNKTSKD